MKVLVLANPFPLVSGGTRRSYEVLRRLSKFGVEPIVAVYGGYAQGQPSLSRGTSHTIVEHPVVFNYARAIEFSKRFTWDQVSKSETNAYKWIPDMN